MSNMAPSPDTREYQERVRRNIIGDRGNEGASALQRFLQDQWEISLVGKGLRALGRGVGSAFTAADQATTGSVGGLQGAQYALADLRSGASNEEARATSERVKAQVAQQQEEDKRQTGMTPGLLAMTLGAVEEGVSTFLTRPASTALLATDPGAPIYDDGFQPSDIQEAYRRTDTVSFGRALAASPLNELPVLNPSGSLSNMLGFDNYDVWSDTDMESASENPYYNFFTGASDLGLQLAPLAARPARLSLLEKTGMRGQTGVRGAADLELARREYMEHRRWREGSQSSTSQSSTGFTATPQYGVIYEDTLREAQQIAEAEGRTLADLTGGQGDELAQKLLNRRAEILLQEDPDLLGSVVFQSPNGLVVDTSSTAGRQIYLNRFYPRLQPDTPITIYRGVQESEVPGRSLGTTGPANGRVEPGSGAWWTTNPAVAQRLADSQGRKIAAITLTWDELQKIDPLFVPGPRNAAFGLDDEVIVDYTSDAFKAVQERVTMLDRIEGVSLSPASQAGAENSLSALQASIAAADTSAPPVVTEPGRQTGIGFLMDRTAADPNPASIIESGILSGVTGLDKVKLSNIYARTTDPDTVFSIYMGSKGEFQAIQDLAAVAPHHIWNLAEMDSVIFNDFLNGRPFEPTGEQLNLVQQVFDSALDRDRYFFDVKRTLLDTDGNPRIGDTTMPNALWVEKIRDNAGRTRYAFKTSDYSGAPQWIQKVVESPIGGPTTQFISWVGSRRPLGRVTRSGARPNDMVDEIDAWFNSVPMFRGSKNQVKIGTDAEGNAVMVPVAQYVAEQKARLLQAQVDGNLEGAWREMENETFIVMGLTLGYDAKAAAELIQRADMMRGEAQAVENYLQAHGGYIYSESGQQIVYDPMTLSMLLDSFATTPLDEMLYLARKSLPERSNAANFGRWVPRAGAQLFDEVMKYFRTNVLLRLGYIPKNSIGEPWVASAIAHGTILTDRGLVNTAGNFARNRANNLRRAAYAMEIGERIKKTVGKGATRKDLRIELNNLVIAREDALATIDTLQADLDAIKAGIIPPSRSPLVAARARATMFEAHKIIRSIEATLDQQVPEWRQVVEPATVAQVSERLRFYRAVLGEDPDYLNDLRDEFGSILARSYENTVLPSQRVQQQIDGLNGQLAAIDARLDKLSEDFNRPSVDKRDVSVARNQEDNIARGRDYQAIALQRQRTSLIKQRDALLDEKRRIEETGVDAFGEFRMSVSDRSRAEYLQEQIGRLEGLIAAGDTPEVRSMVDELQGQYDNYLRSVDREVDASAEQRDAMINRVEEIEAQMREVQERLGVKVAKLDSVRGDRVQFGAGRMDMTFIIGGEKFTVPGSLADDQYALGSGWRAEVSATQTTRSTYDPSFRAGTLTSRLRDAGQVEVIDRYDPRYFDELAYVVNAHFRDDRLIGQILQGATKGEVAAWLRTPDGRDYQRSLGKNYLTTNEVMSQPVPALTSNNTVRMLLESATTLDEVWNIVHAYLPTEQVRKFVADRRVTGDFPNADRSIGVTGGELQALLANEENLSQILSARGVWETYAGPLNRVKEAGALGNKALDVLWRYAMTMPETLLARNPFFDREFRRQMERRINIIAEQAKERNITVTKDQWNRILESNRQAARRESLAEMEKTFYNIRRYSSPVYALRFLTSFPGAVFNSLYRYGRFAWREPERMLVGALALGEVISILGVDGEGNPVGDDNIDKAVYLVIPGTKESPEDTGRRVPIGSIATMFADLPQLSWAGNVLVSDIVARNPKNDERFRKALDSIGMGWYYEDLFPYGPASNPLSNFFGGYQKDIWRGLRGPSDTDFIMSSVQFYADSMAKWEQGGYQGEAPTFEQAIEDTHAYYFATMVEIGPLTIPVPALGSRAVQKFISPFSINQPAPGAMMRDAWYRHREQFPNDTEEARRTFLEKHGDWARWYTYSSSEYTAYLPASIDVFERVWEKYPHLVREMVSVAGDDAISYVNLLALDADQTFNPAVSSYLRNNALPGDDVPVLRRIQPERFDNIVRVNDGWDIYSREVVKHEAELARLRELRDNAETTELANFYRDEIYRNEQSWDDWMINGPLGQNEAWQVARNDRGQDKADNAALFLSKIVNDPKFAQDEGKTQYWQNIAFFLTERERALVELGKIRSNDDKTEYKSRFRTWVRDEFVPMLPEFLPVYERYFEKEWE